MCDGFSTKVHVLCNARGNPVKFIVTSGNQHDVTQAVNLVTNFKGNTVLADKGYDSQHVVDFIEEHGGTTVIPSRVSNKTTRDIDRIFIKRDI